MKKEDSDFRSLFGDARPLAKGNRIERSTSPANSRGDDGAKALARKLASGELDDEKLQRESLPTFLPQDYVSDEYVDWLKPEDLLEHKRAGVQEGVYKKLRLGKYPIDGRLDLHRLTVKEAKREVSSFLVEAQENDSRCVLILHGKGDRNPERQATLKSYLAKWLKETSIVLAFHSAQQHHGGRGAAYVLLKKSEAMKERTREKFNR